MAKAKKRVVKKAAKKRVAKKEVILPKKLSALVKIALTDIRKVERMKEKFIVNMNDWVQPTEAVCKVADEIIISRHQMCSVCAAGSIMVMRLGANPERYATSASFKQNEAQLEAVNALRQGSATSAAEYLMDVGDLEPKERQKLYSLNRVMPEYDYENPEHFHRAMEKFQHDLEKAGY